MKFSAFPWILFLPGVFGKLDLGQCLKELKR